KRAIKKIQSSCQFKKKDNDLEIILSWFTLPKIYKRWLYNRGEKELLQVFRMKHIIQKDSAYRFRNWKTSILKRGSSLLLIFQFMKNQTSAGAAIPSLRGQMERINLN